MKQCSKCKITQASDQFRIKRNVCKACEQIYNKAHKAANKLRDKHRKRLWRLNNLERAKESGQIRKATINKLVHDAKSKPCCDCNNSFPFYAMDLDHIDATTKLFDPCKAWTVSTAKVHIELAKCETRCANCHRLKTFNEKPQPKHTNSKRIIVATMKGMPCMDCHKLFHHCQMDYDHRDDEPKLLNVSALVSRRASWKRILAEIAKCDLICANCHRIRTYDAIQKNKIHIAS